jgi:hypothetical protein
MAKHKRRRNDKEVKSVVAAKGWLVHWFDTEKNEPVIEQYRSALDAQLRVQELGVIGISARVAQK